MVHVWIIRLMEISEKEALDELNLSVLMKASIRYCYVYVESRNHGTRTFSWSFFFVFF